MHGRKFCLPVCRSFSSPSLVFRRGMETCLCMPALSIEVHASFTNEKKKKKDGISNYWHSIATCRRSFAVCGFSVFLLLFFFLSFLVCNQNLFVLYIFECCKQMHFRLPKNQFLFLISYTNALLVRSTWCYGVTYPVHQEQDPKLEWSSLQQSTCKSALCWFNSANGKNGWHLMKHDGITCL